LKAILIVGEAYGENEDKIKAPFVGSSGVELLRMLSEAGIVKWTDKHSSLMSMYWRTGKPGYVNEAWELCPQVQRTNVFMLRPPGNKIEALCGPRELGIRGYPPLGKSAYVRREFISELERLGEEISDLDPNLILCLGATALWALSGNAQIGKYRGVTRLSTFTALDYKLLPTYHPANILRQWENRPIVLVDLMKARREAEFPEVRRPEREIWVEPSLGDIDDFDKKYIQRAKGLSVDIETNGELITCIGFAPSASLALVVPFYDGRRKDKSYWPSVQAERGAWQLVRSILERGKPPKVFQNGLYDISFLKRTMNINVAGAEHDTMLLHHALQPESLKALGHLGSLYTDEGSWKAEHSFKTIKRDQ